jgi:xanthine dehydrogenase YagT iron-sulfur-binding subunit
MSRHDVIHNNLQVDNASITRRGALIGSAAMAACCADSRTAMAQTASATSFKPTNTLAISTTINGRRMEMEIDPRTSLLDLLRERIALTGAKKGCDHGQCGACTVHVDGRRVASCLTLAAKINGKEVLTIEGVSSGDNLHPMQQAFIDHDALQCGYCTPGQIMAAIACVKEGHATSREQIREYMSGNICRCGAYVGIVAAVEDAVVKMGRN